MQSAPPTPPWPAEAPSLKNQGGPWQDLLMGFSATALCTLLAWLTRDWGDLDFHIMLFVACTVLVALRFGRPAWLLSVLLSMVAYEYFFESPIFSLKVANWPNLLMFGAMLAIAQVVSGLVIRLRLQTHLAQARAKEVSLLYALSRALSRERTSEGIAREATLFLGQELALPVLITIGNATPPGADYFSVPIQETEDVLGHLSLPATPGWEAWAPVIQACARPIARALERVEMSMETVRARVEAEAERSRSALLSGVSHDLRTPLSAIGSASMLLSQDGELMAPAERREIADLICSETSRLNHLVENILEITRLDRADVELKREWQPLEGVVGSTLIHLEAQLGPVPVQVDLPADLPLVYLDGAMAEQLLVNLLENALKYAPGSAVVLCAEARAEEVLVEVRDGGPGVPAACRDHIFDKFYRTPGNRCEGGIGLGLAICKAIVRAHGGRIWVEEAAGGGASFRFTLLVDHGPKLSVDGSPS